MKKNYLLFLALILISTTSWGQYRWELGGFLGVTSYQGDFVASSIPSVRDAGFGIGINATYAQSNTLFFRGGITVGKINGSDLNYDNLETRGLAFSAVVKELSAVAMWEPLGAKRYLSGASFKRMVSPYIFGGLGVVNVSTDLDVTNLNSGLAHKVEADKNAEYFNTRLTIPVGIGVKLDVNEFWVVGFEARANPLFNDYLDGVSIAGNPETDDWYYFLGFTMSHRLRNSRF